MALPFFDLGSVPRKPRITSHSMGCAALRLCCGGGVIPAFLGYAGEAYTFSKGIMVVGCLMLSATILVIFLKIGQYDA